MIKPSKKSNTKIRIILADDHNIVRAGIRQLLESARDIEVLAEAGNGEDAQVLIQTLRPDVAVIDIQMPKISGIDVTHWVREHVPEVGILILTAYNDDPYVKAVIKAGANGYVLKTANPEELIQAVRDVKDGNTALAPAIARKLMLGRFQQEDKGFEELTERELEVLNLAAKGHTNKAIGIRLSISDRTVQVHLAHIFAKLRATSRTEAVMRGVALGWIAQSTTPVANE